MGSVVLAIVLLTLLGIGAVGMTMLVPFVYERLPAIQQLRRELRQGEHHEQVSHRQLEAAHEQRRQVDDDLTKADKNYRELVQRQGMFPLDRPLPVVEHGLATQNNKLFEVHVHSTAVRRARRLKQSPPVNPFWEEPRYVLVWAASLGDARLELNNTYPLSKDWHVEIRGEVPL